MSSGATGSGGTRRRGLLLVAAHTLWLWLLLTPAAAIARGQVHPAPPAAVTLLEEELMRRLCDAAGLGLVRHTSGVIAATSGAVAIGDLSVAAGVSSTVHRHRVRDGPRRTDRLGRSRR
ncbi:hypothetical protein [Micromonospora sp. NPDC049102]|uniref:hypothetical protein n=1 Tax=Micromonospora sp. NPDC049102 TaxID=3364265 RepID=UPI003722C6FE